VKRERLVEALHGGLTLQQRGLLGMHLNLIETIEASIAQLDRDIERAVTPFRGIVERLKAIPGLSQVSVPALLGEIGVDMSQFKTHGHLVSWARLCPRLDESAGKVHSTRTLKGAAWTKTLLTQAAWAAARAKNSYLHAQFLRLRARRGAKKAIVAVAASILTIVYHVIRDGTDYRDLGATYFQTRDRSRLARRFVVRLQQMGYNVQITEAIGVKKPLWAVSLADSPQTPLILTGDLERQRIVWIGFDTLQSTWPLRISFPIFIANAVEWLNPSATSSAQLMVRAGEAFRLPLGQSVKSAKLTGPDGKTRVLELDPKAHELLFGETYKQGIYRLTAGTNTTTFCVNLLDAAESNIMPREELPFGRFAKVTASKLKSANSELWRWLAMAGLGVLLFEWWWYHKRTV